ncbi:MAG TPA: alpha/beta hydrolase [Vicinamibacteria bacterium]
MEGSGGARAQPELSGTPTTRYEEDTLAGPAGPLHHRVWLPAEAPKGVVVLVHGLAEHSGRYTHVGEYLAARGWVVHAFDYRGHGRSPGPRVHVDRFDDFLDDTAAVLEAARRRHPGLPVFVVGHSLGGLIALLYVLDHPETLAGVVATSPALGTHPSLRPSRAKRTAGRLLSVVAPQTLFRTGLDPRQLSRDPEVVRAYAADPLVSRTVSARFYTETARAMAKAHEKAARLSVPALVMASANDAIVDADATRRWLAAAPPGRIEAVFYDPLAHELFNEPEREEVLARLEQWLERRAR